MNRWFPIVRALAVPAISLMAAACDTSPDIELPGGVSFLERDSAGVVVATTLGTRARSPVGWVVDTVPEYQVGDSDGEEPYLFSRIEGARQLADGRVVVVDRATCDWRFFGSDGVFLERFGGRGDGPGEFRDRGSAQCKLVLSLHPDSLFGWDGANLSVFNDGGRFVRRQLLPWPNYGVATVVGVADGVAAVEQGGIHIPGGPGQLSRAPDPAHFAMLELETQRLLWEKIGLQRYHTYGIDNPGGLMGVKALPFDIRPSAAISGDGLYLTLGENQGPEIRQYGPGGHLGRVIRLVEPVPGAPSRRDIRSLADFELEGWEVADSTRARAYRERESRYSALPMPEVMPVFSGLLVDDEGWLWAELYRFEVLAPVRWLVFDPNGEGVGSVDLPPDLDVWQIGRDFVLGVWEDELGVEYVRRHALTGRR